MANRIRTDVAIIGAGPAGSTCGGFLRKYNSSIKVSIFERETFPRDHVGESQLPLIGTILNELGVWDKVEAANFPIKIGATYKWGRTDELWDFHFLPNGNLKPEERPAKFSGQRTKTAFQVDRAIYDQILANHATSLGCKIEYGTKIREVNSSEDRVDSLILEDGTLVEADHYIDASGHSGILRRAIGVRVEEPSHLKNIAIWDYWQDADWAVTIGVGGTRVQVMSVGFGWLWFIPVSPSRVSIGLVCPAEYFKKEGRSARELYLSAIEGEPRIKSLTARAAPEGRVATTKDWSYVANRMGGENWYLTGEALGFADPILAAGMTLAHVSARECAFSILAERSGGSKSWLVGEYEQRNRRRVLQHIKFADYWYTANTNFEQLREYTREIALDAGLELDAEKAFQWLGTGGFIEEDMGVGGIGMYNLRAVHEITRRFSDVPSPVATQGFNVFLLKLRGAEIVDRAIYENGTVCQVKAYGREGKFLPLNGLFGLIVNGLNRSPRLDQLIDFLQDQLRRSRIPVDESAKFAIYNCLEAMVRDGWVQGKRVADVGFLDFEVPANSSTISKNRDSISG